MWPGDPVGEGFKTFVEQLGFPPQLGEDGYPVQVNATHPGGEEAQRDEPFPGMLQRAEAGEGTARAVNGFSPDGEPQDVPDDGDDNDDETGGGGGIPGLPELPGLPGLSSGSGSGSGLLGVLGGSSAAADTPGLPGLPPEVAALVDVEGFTTVSSLESGDRVVARSRAAVGRVSLLGGLITSSGVTSLATTRGDGDRTVATGETTYGDLVVLGQRFRYGPDGFEAVGNPTPIPGLPDQAGAALGQLGITVGLPAPTLEEDGDEATATAAGLVIEIDLARLKGNLAALPLGDLVGALPDEARELKDALSLLTNISSRMVVTLGMAQSTVETTPPLDPPPPPDGEEETDGEEEATEAGGGGGGGGAGLGATGGTDAGGPSPDSSAPVAAAGGVSTIPLSATPGLPPLFSIPGLLLMGALALAAVGGGYVRKLGVLALGGGAPCPHGLDSGLPDLRKA